MHRDGAQHRQARADAHGGQDLHGEQAPASIVLDGYEAPFLLPWPTGCSYVLLPRRWSDPGLTRGVKSARRRDWDAHHGEGKRERAAAHDDGVPRVQHRGVHRRLDARPRRQLLAVTRQHEEAVVEGEGDGARLPQKVQCLNIRAARAAGWQCEPQWGAAVRVCAGGLTTPNVSFESGRALVKHPRS